MEQEGVLTFILLAPIVAAIIIMFLPRDWEDQIKVTALVSTIVSFLLAIYVYVNYDILEGGFQFVEKIPWLNVFSIYYHLGVDGINLPMLLLTAILGIAAILASFRVKTRVKEFFVLTLLIIAGVIGVFLTLDLFFFILFYELASIPMYFLIAIWGSDGRTPWRETKKGYAALKLILYLQFGGALLLVSFFTFYLFAPQAGLPHSTFDLTQLLTADFSHIPSFSAIVFFLLFIGFGIEAGLVPVHTWLPDGHSAAPTAISMLLAGVLLKMGGYGMIRVAIGLLPEGAKLWLPLFAIVAVINILYGAFNALKQVDIKYIVAYSSVSHMGIVFLGLATFNAIGFNGAIYQMFSHGIITALLFALAGLVYEKTHTRDITQHGGLALKMPFIAATFVVGGLATLGLPSMSGFVAEFLVFVGTFKVYKVLAILAIFGLVVTATYVLRAVQKVFFGTFNEKYTTISDALVIERIHIVMLIFFIFLFGVYPSLLLDVSSVGIKSLLDKLMLVMY